MRLISKAILVLCRNDAVVCFLAASVFMPVLQILVATKLYLYCADTSVAVLE